MDCNKQEAMRALELAENKFKADDVEGAKHMAKKAQKMFRNLPGLRQTLAAYDVHLAAKKASGGVNWHAVLGTNPAADLRRIREQFRKMSILTHPDKNPSAAADGAFKLVVEAWTKLSNGARSNGGGAGANSNKAGKGHRDDPNTDAREVPTLTLCPACGKYGCGYPDKARTIKKCEFCEVIILLANDLNLRVEGRGSVNFTWDKLSIGVQKAEKIEIKGGSTIQIQLGNHAD